MYIYKYMYIYIYTYIYIYIYYSLKYRPTGSMSSCALLEHIHIHTIAHNAEKDEKRKADLRNLASVNGGKGTLVPIVVPAQITYGDGVGCRALALRSPFIGGSQGTLSLYMQVCCFLAHFRLQATLHIQQYAVVSRC